MDVRMPDGTIVTNVPDNITQTELARRFNLYQQPEVTPETTFGGHAKEFLKGIPAGAVGLLETAGTGIGALLPEKIEQQGRAAMKENLAGIKEALAPEKGYEDAMSRKLGEGLGSTIPFAVAGPLGWAGRAASVGVGGAAGAGEARLRAEAGGASGGERAAATAAGILPGLLDFLPFSAAEKAVGIVRRALIAGGVEGATEAAQELAQNAIAKGAYNPDQALLEGTGESAGYGGAIGAMAQALVDSALHIKHRGGKTTPVEEKPQPAGVMPAGPTAPGAELQGQLFTEEAAPAAAAPQPFTEQDNVRLEELAAKPNLSGEEQQEFAYLMISKDAAEAPTEEAAPAQPEAAAQPDMIQEAEAKQAEELYAQDAARDAEETKQIEAMYEQEANAETEPVLPGVDVGADTAAMEALVPAQGDRQARQEEQKAAAAERQLRAEEQKLADEQAKMAADVAAVDARVAKSTPAWQMPLPGMAKPLSLFRAIKPDYKGGDTIKDGVYITSTEADARAFAGPKGTVIPVEATPEELLSGAVSPEPKLNTKMLDAMGIPPAAPVRERLKDAKLITPAQLTKVRNELLTFAQNPNTQEPTRAAIDQFVNSDMFRVQGEMFGPKGGIRKGVIPSTVKETPSAVTGIEPAGVRVSPEAAVAERGERRAAAPSAARTEAPKPTGLGTTKRSTVEPAGRKGAPQPAVKKETKEAREARETAADYREAKSVAFDIGLTLDEQIAKDVAEPTLAELLAAQKKGVKKLEGAAALAIDLDAKTLKLIKGGDVQGALNSIAESVGGVGGRIAKALAPLVKDVKVGIASAKDINRYSEAGGDIAGMFIPKENTIIFNEDMLSAHSVLHEAVHAATSHVLSNKNHPVTKQLQNLFDEVKASLDTMYGAESLDEFVAEAFSNPEFQAKLASISPKGAPVSAWQRFAGIIKNFVRRMAGMETTSPTAMGEADKLISAILSTSPATRDAGSLYMISALGKGAEWVNGIIDNRKFLPDGPNVDAFHEFLTGTVPKAAKKALMGALPLHAFADVAESRIPTAETLKRTIELQSSEEHKALESLNESVKDVNRWYRKQTAEVRGVFDRIGPDSSRMQVDPSKDRSKYAGKKDEDGNDLGKAWDSLQADWKKIGPEGQKLYKQMRDTYAKQRDKLQELLGARIDELVTDNDTAKKLKNEIYARLAKRGGIDPYFPLHREGDYWLMFTGKDPRFGNVEPVVRAFTSKRARDRFIEELKADMRASGMTDEAIKADIKEYGNFKASNFKDLPPTAFASNVVKTLEANKKVDPEVIDEVMRLYIDLLPESSFAQSFRTRKGTLGYEGSAVDTFRKKTYSIERQMSSMQYGAKYAKIIADTEEHIKAKGSDTASVLLGDELIARAKLAASPKVPKWAKVATSLNFNMFMGLNISSALVNMTQIPLVVAPYLGGKYGLKETTQAIGRATRIVMNSGKDRTIDDYLSTAAKPIKRKIKSYLSIDNYDFKDPELKHLETLARVADARGQLNHSQMQDALDMDSTDTLLGRVNATTGFVFHHAERINRQVSMVAAYELELQKLVGKGKPLSSATKEQMEAAAHEAIFNTEITNGDTAAAAAPRLAQGASGIGKVMFLFKRYGASMYYMLFKTARQALSNTDPETRKAAMKQLAGIYGSSALLAGVRGVPMFGLMAWIFDMFRDDDEDNASTLAQKWMGDTAYKGALNALTGFEISGRVGLSDLIFRDNPYSKDLTPTQALFQTLGGPVLSIADKSFRGFKQIGEGNIERGVEQIMPSAIGNMMKSMRYATEGTTTLRGDPITGEVGAWNSAGQFFGFAPAEYIQQQEINANIKRIDKATNQNRSKLLKQYYIALREGDADGMKGIAERMQEFSQKHPGARITGETIKNSMAQHRKTSATMYHGITLSKNMRSELLQNAGEYED